MKKTKKAALRLVQSAINFFIISIIPQKLSRKNEQKTSENGPKSPSNGAFSAEKGPRRQPIQPSFSATHFRHSPPLLLRRLRQFRATRFCSPPRRNNTSAQPSVLTAT
jgi:hypothetical protein